jgi:hypothetical protein
MKRVGLGLYEDDDGALHLSIPELLAACGAQDTAENRALMVEVAREVVAQQFPGVPITETE